jgi:REP element-mobilizing transposase RayT
MHCVFSTKERRRLISPELQQRLYPYLGGIAREHKMKALSIGGVEDHVHYCYQFPRRFRLPSQSNFSREIHRSGFTKRFPTNGFLNGRRVMGHSALPSRAWKTQ